VGAELDAIARDTQSAFGRLDEWQLNWQPDRARWSVAQCFDHLLKINREIFQSIDATTDRTRPRTVWQRLPGLPALFGRIVINSQRPEAARRRRRRAAGGPCGRQLGRRASCSPGGTCRPEDRPDLATAKIEAEP
jgi:DinB superfamily